MWVSEHDIRQLTAVDVLIGGKDFPAESGHHLPPGVGIMLEQLMPYFIGAQYCRAKSLKHPCRRALAAGDATGEANDHHLQCDFTKRYRQRQIVDKGVLALYNKS